MPTVTAAPVVLPHIPPACAVLSVAHMYAADKAAAAAGIPSLTLMEAAGAAIARAVRHRWAPQRVAVLCGPGYNGGDGFVAARLLAKEGWAVHVALLGDAGALRGDAAVNAGRWRDMGGDIAPLSPQVLDGRPLVIDALFGAGLTRPLSGMAKAAVERINAEALTCVAVDVPSGLSGDTGCVLGGDQGAAPRCTASVTFFRPKPGHLLYPGRDLCGDLTVADIGIPDSVLPQIASPLAHNGPVLWRIPEPKWSDHKYQRGSAIVMGGGVTTGAARLAARAARRVGAGLLTLAVPPAAFAIYAISEPGALIQPMTTAADLDALMADGRRNGVLIGPGYGTGTDTCMAVLRILSTDKAVVLDADALTSFRDDPAQLFAAIKRRPAPVVMTPHRGEFDRLFTAPGDKLTQARAAAELSGAVVVLKGPDTVIAAPGGAAAITTNGPPWLATGGSGDVLAGMVLGLLVQKMAPWQAACAAVWLHGAAATGIGRGLIAEDLPEALPKVFKSL